MSFELSDCTKIFCTVNCTIYGPILAVLKVSMLIIFVQLKYGIFWSRERYCTARSDKSNENGVMQLTKFWNTV